MFLEPQYLSIKNYIDIFLTSMFLNFLLQTLKFSKSRKQFMAWTYLQLPLRQRGAGNVYLLVLSSWKVNIAENPIAVMGL